MRVLTLFAVLTLAMVACSGQDTSGQVASDVASPPGSSARDGGEELYLSQSVDDIVLRFMAENNIPGMSLAIVQAPYITRVVGYGLANTKSKRRVGSRTVFPVGQMTTAYTAVAVMQLVEAGKIKLDDHVDQHLNRIPQSWHAITVRELITHSSGIPSYIHASGFRFNAHHSPEGIVDLVRGMPLNFKPGAQTEQSATNYYLLGMIIEKVSGERYQDYVTKHQLEVLGLKQTFFPSSFRKIVKNEVDGDRAGFKHSEFKKNPIYIDPVEVASGYTSDNGSMLETPESEESATLAYAGIMASAYDVSAWDIGLAGDILIGPESRAFLYNPTVLKDGSKSPANAGWQFNGHQGLMSIGGSIPGFTSFLSRYTAPSELICVTLLANRDNVQDLDILSQDIASTYNSKLAVPSTPPWSTTRLSPFSIAETLARLTSALTEQEWDVHASIDRADNDEVNGQKVSEMHVLVFSNPSGDSKLMQNTKKEKSPLKAIAWKDDTGQVRLSVTDVKKLAKQSKYEGKGSAIDALHDTIARAATRATTAY